MGRVLVPGSRVFFLSAENDYLANHLAPRLRLYAYNVGGDKNQILSEPLWPDSIKALRAHATEIDGLAPLVVAALRSGDVDAVVVPYFNLRWDSYGWPPIGPAREERRGAVFAELAPPALGLALSDAEWFMAARLASQRP
jgi:hypothetical protein